LILVVDDSADNVAMISLDLQHQGYRVVTAANGEDAVNVATQMLAEPDSDGHQSADARWAWVRRAGFVKTTRCAKCRCCDHGVWHRRFSAGGLRCGCVGVFDETPRLRSMHLLIARLLLAGELRQTHTAVHLILKLDHFEAIVLLPMFSAQCVKGSL
jgi:hypothetical protein